MRHDDDLICIVDAETDLVTTSYRWSSKSRENATGTTIVRPLDVEWEQNGRWLSWTSPLRFSPVVGGNAYYLHELVSGPLRRVIVLDRHLEQDEINSLVMGQVPSVVVEATDDDPEDATQNVGHRWITAYDFTVSVITENLRDRREHAQGPSLDTDIDPGANSLDGFIKALLSGTQLYDVLDGVLSVRLGRGNNSISDLGQRRVVRSRVYTVHVTEELPNAPNDYGAAEEADLQAQMTDLHDQSTLDPENFVVSGMTVPTGAGYVMTVAAGTAVVGGEDVTYAGELHTFSAFADTYRDLLPNGTMAFVSVALQAQEPDVTATALRVGVTRTNGSGVLEDRYIATVKSNYMNPVEIPLDE